MKYEDSKMLKYVHSKMNPELGYKAWYYRFWRKYRKDGNFTLEFVKYKTEFYAKEHEKLEKARALEKEINKDKVQMESFHPFHGEFGEIK